MPDIKTFWDSLKYSWARRLTSNTAWNKILQANLLKSGYDTKDLLYGGPNDIMKCANSQTNKFWKEVLLIFSKICSAIVSYQPHYFYHQNLFDNEDLKYGLNVLKKFDFPMLWSKNVLQIGDLYDCKYQPPRMLSRTDLNSKFSINLDFLRYHNLKSSVNAAAERYGQQIYNPKSSDLCLPRLPLILKISFEQKKGCQFYYKTLRSVITTTRGTIKGEGKWAEKLAFADSTLFWNNVYKITKKLLLPNKLIWTQIQINKCLLPTNYSVNHYDKNVSPQCSFCGLHPEKLHLLIGMGGCEVVDEFWVMVDNTIKNFYPRFVLTKRVSFFGDIMADGSAPINNLLALARYFVYQQKFTSGKLDEVSFINYVRDHLLTIVQVKQRKGDVDFLLEWQIILNHFLIDYLSSPDCFTPNN